MTIAELVADLRAAGVHLDVDGERLRAIAPPGVLTEERRRALLEHRDELLERLRWTTDPRPDAGGVDGWGRLLEMAYDYDGDRADGLFGALRGLRCGGARLVRRADGSIALSHGEWGREYDALRARWLVPHAAVVTRLLRQLAEGDRAA